MSVADAPVVWSDGARLRIEHTTEYQYHGAITSSYNEVRLTPEASHGQRVVDTSIEISPSVRLRRYVDYFGTTVHTFDLQEPHDHLVIRARSLVETPAAPPRPPEPTWSDIAAHSDEFAEFLEPSAFAFTGDAFGPLTAELTAVGDPSGRAERALERIGDHMTFERGFTSVATTAPEAWRRRRGVCQDFAHVSLAVLRALGIPARYVSGYLHPDTDARPGEPAAAESHAWIELWLGDWVGMDPSHPENPIDGRYVVLARGRDYADVPPIKGIFTGAGASAPLVSVELTLLA